jgi:SAM-dependent methyltransferase
MRLAAYPRILATLKAGGRFLDVGCCLAQDLRKLAFDGAPSGSLYGAELLAPYFDLGYDLFRDRHSLEAHFVQADILDDGPDSPLEPLRGSMDVVHLGMVLHVFSWEEQRQALERCVELLRPQRGALIVGQAVGHAVGKSSPSHEGRYSFKHSDASFKKLFGEIEQRTGVRFECRARIDEGLGVGNGKRKWDGDAQTRRLYFEVERL